MIRKKNYHMPQCQILITCATWLMWQLMNEAAKKMLEIKFEDCIGRKCYKVIASASDVCSFCKNKQLTKGEYFKWENFNPGIQRHFELTDIVFELDGRDVKLQSGVDITDSKNKVEDGAIYIASPKTDTSFKYEEYLSLDLRGLETLLAATQKHKNEVIGFLGVDNPINNISDKTLLRSVSLFVSNDLKSKDMLNELERLAAVDVFSGLLNRNKYMQTIEEIIADKVDTVGIVYLDINGLKQVNDEYGHEYGDSLILKVVSMMKECFADNLFRTGGDEFVALYLNGDRNNFEEKMRRLRSIVNIQTNASVSIGSSWCTDTNDISRQIAHADELMYVDKQNYYANHQYLCN